MWIGRATAYANRCPLADLTPVDVDGQRLYVRDSTAQKRCSVPSRKRKASCLAAVWGIQPKVMDGGKGERVDKNIFGGIRISGVI